MSDEWTRLPLLADPRHTGLDPNMSFRFAGRSRRFSSGPPPVGGGFELREDGSNELREDGGIEVRE